MVSFALGDEKLQTLDVEETWGKRGEQTMLLSRFALEGAAASSSTGTINCDLE